MPPFLAEPGALTAICEEERPPAVPSAEPPKHHVAMSSAAVERIAERFRILGDPLRMRLIQELRDGEKSVSELAAAVGASQPNASKHLRLIQSAGIAGRRQEGNLVYYSITDQSVFALCDAVCAAVGDYLAQEGEIADELRGQFRGPVTS